MGATWVLWCCATAMLGQALRKAYARGIEKVLLTVAPNNAASRLVVQRNGGVADGINHEGEIRYWIGTPARGED